MATYDEGTINNLLNDVAELKSLVRGLLVRDVSAIDAAEIMKDFGDIDYKAVDDEGRLRVVMSAVNLLSAFGISAHFAGFAEDGVTPTVWIDADYGGITALGGNMVIDATGLNIFGLNLAQYFTATENGEQRQAFLGMYLPQGVTTPVFSILFTGPSGSNLLTNGDAETGDLTGWTDADSAWEANADSYEGSYAFKHLGSAEAYPGKLKQNVAVTAGDILTISFAQKRTAGILAPRVNITWKTSAPATISTDKIYGTTSLGYTTFLQSFIAPVGTASVDIEIVPGDPLNDEFFDDIEVYIQEVSTELRFGDGELKAIVDGVTFDLLNGSRVGASNTDFEIVSSTTETAIVEKVIPGGTLPDGYAYEIEILGSYKNQTGVNRAPTIKFYYGGYFATIYSTSIATSPNRHVFVIRILLRRTSDSAQFVKYYIRRATEIIETENTTTYVEDSTVDQTMKVTVTHPVSNANLSFTARTTRVAKIREF